MNPVILIGTGVAGYTFAKAWRQLDPDTPLLIITEDDGASYSKPMLSNAWGKNKTPSTLAMADAGTMATQLNANILTHTQVRAINTDTHSIDTSDKTYHYSKLILATGAAPIPLNLEGNNDAIWQVNSLSHYRDFYPTLNDKKHLVIIGSGLIGCEFANDAMLAGKQVTLIGMEKQLLANIIPPEMADVLCDTFTAAGIRFLPERTATRIDHDHDGVTLTLNTGETIQADMCLSAVGIRPRLDLANASNIHCHRGIVVDNTLATSAPDVYAIGDGIEFEGSVRSYIAPILLQARTLAEHLGKKDGRKGLVYPALPMTVKTPLYPIACVLPRIEGSWEIDSNEKGICAKCMNDNGELIGFALSDKRCQERMALAKEVVL